jgi:hypothetical protein
MYDHPITPISRNILRDGYELRHVGETIYLTYNGSVIDTITPSNILEYLTCTGNIRSDRYHPDHHSDHTDHVPKEYGTLPRTLTLSIDWIEPVMRSPDHT